MKSVIVTEFGGPDVLQLREVPKPEPQAGQVLVKVMAAGLNYADIMQRVGMYPGGPKPPFGAGFEIAGVVDRVGPGVTQWKAGDAVTGFCSGGYSEYAVADAIALIGKPDQLSFLQAAAIPCQYLTAYHVLVTLGQLTSGQTVLIQAAAGGLGTLLVQIARNIGATVIGTCSSDEKCALLRSIGCHHPVNYAQGSFRNEVMRITEQNGCDLVIESVGGAVFDKSLRCVKSRGRLIVVGVASGQPRSVETLDLLVRNVTVSGFHLMGYASDVGAMANAQRDLHAWLGAGKLTILVNHVYPLEKAAEAQQAVSERKTTGKVVLNVSE